MDEAVEDRAPTAQRLDPRYKTVLRWRAAIAGIALTALATGAELFLATVIDWRPGPVMLTVALLALAAVIVMPGRRYRRWSYARRAEALEIAHGVLVRVETSVPFGRVQHIDIARGPIERLCGVATLALHTAGTHNSVVHLPGLAVDDAEAMRAEIREHIRREQP